MLTHSNCTGAPVLATRQRDHVAGAEGFTFVCALYVCRVCVCRVCVLPGFPTKIISKYNS